MKRMGENRPQTTLLFTFFATEGKQTVIIIIKYAYSFYFHYFPISAALGCGAKNSWKFPCVVHRRKGFRIQGIHFPSCHSKLYVPSWWFHQPQRHWRKIHLRQQVRRWELHLEAYRPRSVVNGKLNQTPTSLKQRLMLFIFRPFLVYRDRPTLDQTRTVPNSSLQLWKHPGWTIVMLCSAPSPMAWMLSRRSNRMALKAGNQSAPSRSVTVANSNKTVHFYWDK